MSTYMCTDNIICNVFTSIPSLLIIALSILRIADRIVLGGGNTVIPMLIAFERLESNITISFLVPSCF